MFDLKGRLAKGLGIVAVLAVAVLLSGVASRAVFAEPPTPVTPSQYMFLNWWTIQQMANTIGTTPTELITQLQGGKTLAQIAQEKGVSKEKLVDTIVFPYKDQLDARVRYGYLTATRADALLKTMRQQVETLVSQPLPETALAPYAEGDEYYDGYCPAHATGYGPGMMGGYGPGMMGSFGGFGSGMMGGGYGWSGGGMMGGFWDAGYGARDTTSGNGSALRGGFGGFGSDTRDSTAGSGPTARSSFGRFGSGMMGRGWR